MEIFIIHKNQEFASYLKHRLLSYEVNKISILSLKDFIYRNNRRDHLELDKCILLLDAHIKGRVKDCEGFEVVGDLRYMHSFTHPIILLSWYSIDDLRKYSDLKRHLDCSFLIKYESRELPNTMLLPLPSTTEHIYNQLIRY